MLQPQIFEHDDHLPKPPSLYILYGKWPAQPRGVEATNHKTRQNGKKKKIRLGSIQELFIRERVQRINPWQSIK